VLSWSAPALADVLAGWDVHGQAGSSGNFGASPLAPTTSGTNISVGGLTRGGGISTSGTGAARGWGGADWQNTSEAAAVSGGDFVTFTVTPNSGFSTSFSSISQFNYRRSASGAASGTLQYQVGAGGFVDVAALNYSSTSSSGGTLPAIDLTAVAALQNVPGGTTVTFRIVNWGGTSSSGTWYVFDVANTTASDFEISGTTVVGTTPVNGVCGSANGQRLSAAPTTNLCSVGTASSVAGTGPWTWTCAGTGGGSTASCSANLSSAQPFTVFHMNDVHARLTPHKWIAAQHGPGPDVFEDVGGAAYLAGELLSLVKNDPTALVLDGGDISEGSPIGDMNCTTPANGGTPTCSNNGYGNGGMTAFYSLLQSKIAAIGGARGTRGIDALVVGNHDVRDVSYITNMEQMRNAGVPVISVNVRDISTHQPHFAPTTTVTVNGVKVGIVGYTTSTATVGASLANTLEVVDCQWTGSSVCNISTYVNDLRNNQHCDVVILLTHDGHSDLVDPATPVIADTADAKVPEIAVTGHWHTWSDTVWQPASLNYKTTFTESSSYMKYIGELHVTGTGRYVSSVQHLLRNSDITPDPDVQALVNNLISQFNAAHPGHPYDEVVGYTNDDLVLDDRMKWWSADEYPWNGNDTAGQWITDGMKWKCDQIAWPSGGGCDLAIEAGGGVRADIPAGPVKYVQIYETYPWADDTYVRVNMTGQDIINFLNANNLDVGFSRELDVTAFDGIIQSVKFNGQPIGLTTIYKVAVNNYMLAHPSGGYAWPSTIAAESDPSGILVRDSLPEFMRTAHGTPGTAYSVGGDRYHLNGQYSGGFQAVVTMMNDADSKPTFDDAFIRLLSATPETLSRRGSKQVPTSIVNSDGSVVASNRLSEQELYRSFLGFKTGALMPGDIIQVLGKASFFGGDPEFVDQEGVYGDGMEFKILGHDPSLAKPAFMASIDAFLNDNYKNHYVKFLAHKVASDTVADQNGASLKIWDRTGYTAASLPGSVGDTLELTGVPTMENFAFRFRSDGAVVSTKSLSTGAQVTSHVDALSAVSSQPITLTATALVSGGGYALGPVADAEVASGSASSNFGTSSNIFIQGTTATGTFGSERGWLKFDLSGIPAGSTISSAILQMWNWKSTGPALPVEARGSTTDTWTETGITWNSQPVLGNVLDTQTLASGVTNTWYYWNLTSLAQSQLNGDKTLSVVIKSVDESQTGGPSYGFDAKEFGSNAPVLRVVIQSTASSVAGVSYFYRFSSDNSTWGAWTAAGSANATAPYSSAFNFPNGLGYYEFYSVATDNLGNTEAAPVYAQSAVHYTTATGASQSITFGSVPSTPVGSSVSLSATATSGLPVSYTSQTPAVCSVNGSQVTTLAVGSCTITADQTGDVGYYLAATRVLSTFQVTGMPQSITFSDFGPLTVGATATLSATATSNLAVSFSSQTTSVCTVSGNTVTAVAVGTCSINANQPGDGAYWSAAPTVSKSATVSNTGGGGGATPQTINFPVLPDQALSTGHINVSATASSGLTVAFASQTSGVCTVSGNTVTLIAVGTCTIVASQVGDAIYAAATPVSHSFSVTSNSGPPPAGVDAPLPLWAVVLLTLTLGIGILRRRPTNGTLASLLAITLGMVATLVVNPAARADDTDPGIYGRLDVSKFGHPPVIRREAVVANGAKHRTSSKAVYMHVAPGQEWHWQSYCRTYDACSVPVYFVTESWFVNVYLPAIGSRDGREQRYRINAARERASERESHHEPSEE
jgi:2',3'-cyclic-nucleotide 2'-phosphodiesterase (5'-nucleotidase family)